MNKVSQTIAMSKDVINCAWSTFSTLGHLLRVGLGSIRFLFLPSTAYTCIANPSHRYQHPTQDYFCSHHNCDGYLIASDGKQGALSAIRGYLRYWAGHKGARIAVLITLIVLATFTSIRMSTQQPEDVIKAFYHYWNQGQPQEAYQLLTTEQQQRLPLRQIVRSLQHVRSLHLIDLHSHYAPEPYTNIWVTMETETIKGERINSQHQVTLVIKGGIWRIDRLGAPK